MTATTLPLTEVLFSWTFAPDLAGVVFEVVPGRVTVDRASGRTLVTVRTRVGARWSTRLAWVDTLRTLEGGTYVPRLTADGAEVVA